MPAGIQSPSPSRSSPAFPSSSLGLQHSHGALRALGFSGSHRGQLSSAFPTLSPAQRRQCPEIPCVSLAVLSAPAAAPWPLCAPLPQPWCPSPCAGPAQDRSAAGGNGPWAVLPTAALGLCAAELLTGYPSFPDQAKGAEEAALLLRSLFHSLTAFLKAEFKGGYMIKASSNSKQQAKHSCFFFYMLYMLYIFCMLYTLYALYSICSVL